MGEARKSLRYGALRELPLRQQETLSMIRLRDHGYMVPEPTISLAVRSTHPTVYEYSGPGINECLGRGGEIAGQNLVGLFRDVAKRLAARCATKAPAIKRKTEPSGMLTPPQVAERLGVSPDMVVTIQSN